MNYVHTQKNLGHSPRKMRLVADMVRKMTPERAVLTLKFTNRGAAQDLAKAITTAMANAKGQSGLVFRTLEVGEGLKMGRLLVGTAGRGRSRPFKRRLSHVRVVLTDEAMPTGKKVKGKKVVSPVVEEKAEVVEAAVEVKEEKKTMKKVTKEKGTK